MRASKIVLHYLLLIGFLTLLAAPAIAQDGFGRDGSPLPDSILGGGAGSCFENNGTPGCDDPSCEAAVCAADAFCCDVAWDGICADQAFEQCEMGEEDAPRARFQVTKDFTDDNPSEVEVTIDCNTGQPLQQSKMISEGDSVVFVVVEYDDGELDCDISESTPDGYSVTYDAFGGEDDAEGCHFDDVSWGGFRVCEITNDPAPVDVVIEKDWVFEGSTDGDGIDLRYDVTLYCDTFIVDGYSVGGGATEVTAGQNGLPCGQIVFKQDSPQGVSIAEWCKRFQGEGPGDDTHTAEVVPEYPNSSCWVDENVYDSAVEVDNDCNNLTVSVGQGASCTITNTVFFEGIPTLSQYGIAMLALLTLGLGIIGFRRFV